MSVPAKVMVPPDGRSMDTMARNRVDLPAPLEPMIVTASPSAISKLMSWMVSSPW